MEIYTEICERCNGRGFLLGSYNNKPIGVLCKTCFGTGSLDWVQKVVGVKLSSDVVKERLLNVRKFESKGIQCYREYPRTEEERIIDLRTRFKQKLEKAKELRKTLGDPIELLKNLME